MVITSAKGKEGVLSGQVINNGPQAATVTIAAPGGGPQLTKKVAARSTTHLSGESRESAPSRCRRCRSSRARCST